MILEFDNKAPIYIQIMDKIKRDIVSGKLKGGDKLTSVREMAESLKVNPNTIQRVYQELELEKVTYTQRGMGTFITEDESVIHEIKKGMSREIIASFIDGMKNLGFTPEEIVHTVTESLKEGNSNGDNI